MSSRAPNPALFSSLGCLRIKAKSVGFVLVLAQSPYWQNISSNFCGCFGVPGSALIFKVNSALIFTLPTEISLGGFSWAALHHWEDGTSEAQLLLLLPDFPSPPGAGCCILARALVLWRIPGAFPGWHGVLHHCPGKLLTGAQCCRHPWLLQVERINGMLPSQALPLLRSHYLAEDDRHVLRHNFCCLQQISFYWWAAPLGWWGSCGTGSFTRWDELI